MTKRNYLMCGVSLIHTDNYSLLYLLLSVFLANDQTLTVFNEAWKMRRVEVATSSSEKFVRRASRYPFEPTENFTNLTLYSVCWHFSGPNALPSASSFVPILAHMWWLHAVTLVLVCHLERFVKDPR